MSSPTTSTDELLSEEFRRRIAAAVARVCPSWLAEERDDLVQTVLLQLVARLRRGEGNRTYSSMYLARAAHGVAVDEIRRRCRRKEVAGGSGIEMDRTSSDRPDPERSSVSREVGNAIRECLGRLVRPRKLAVTLYLHGCSVPEAARRLSWAAKRTENLVYRGLGDLRRCLEKKGMTP